MMAPIDALIFVAQKLVTVENMQILDESIICISNLFNQLTRKGPCNIFITTILYNLDPLSTICPNSTLVLLWSNVFIL